MIQSATMGGLMQRESVRQFVKFCIIGFSSMIIDVGIAKYLTYTVGWYWLYAQTLSFALAVTNGFIWNSMWTFRGMGNGARHTLYMKFMAVNVFGLAMNIFIMKGIFLLLLTPHRFLHQPQPPKPQWLIAKGVAIICVSLWNFVANKKWTFVD